VQDSVHRLVRDLSGPLIIEQIQRAERQGIEVKRRILLAAEAEFALRGFAGTRVDDIATRARKSRNPTCTTTSTPSEHFLTV
jgi:hypothetical protein